MPISKGFLNKKVVIKKEKLITGLILWILLSYPLYAFFYMLREAFRIMSNELGGRVLLVLTPEETFIYNLFYASIAVSIGFMLSLKFILENSSSLKPTRKRLQIRQTLNQQAFFTWTFLLWFGKVTSMLAIWYVIFPLQFDIDFLQEATLFLLLLPIVLFSSTWPHLRLLLGSHSIKWFGLSFSIFIIMSVAFSFKNFIDVNRINNNLLKSSIEYSYKLEVPKSESHQRIKRRSLVTDIYVVLDSTASNKPLLFLQDIDSQIKFTELQRNLNWERDKLSEYERNQLVVNLHIDKNIKMSFVNELKHELRKSNINEIQYSTGVKNSRYPSNYSSFKYLGIQETLYPRYYSKFESFLDSAEGINIAKYSLRIPPSMMYRINDVSKYNRIAIRVSPFGATLNETKVSEDQLNKIVYNFVNKYSPNFLITFEADDNISFGQYIDNLDLIYSQIDKLRNEMSLEVYDKSFDYWYWGEELNSIKSMYPRHIIQWTDEEKRLIKLKKKAGNIL